MDNKESKKIKQNKIIKVSALLGLFLLVFGISYALFSVVLEGTKKNRITTANFGLILTDKNGVEEKNLPEGTMAINLENAVPMSTIEAIDTIEPYEFIIENTGDIDVDYELYFETDENTDLDSKYVKYSLDKTDITGIAESASVTDLSGLGDGDSSDISSSDIVSLKKFMSSRFLSVVKTEKEGKVMYKLDLGTIPAKQKHSYSLKMWLAYSADNNAMNKTFSGKLKTYGTQTTKDSVYVVEKVDISSYQKEGEGYGILWAKRYSDNSIRIEGTGNITDNIDDINFIKLQMNSMYNEQFLKDFNQLLVKYDLLNSMGMQEYDEFGDFYADIMEGKYVIENEAFFNELDTMMENPDYHQYTELYVVDDLISKFSNIFINNYFDKIYLTEALWEVGGFEDGKYLQEVQFVKATNPNIDLSFAGLTILGGSFRSCQNLTKVTLPATLIRIGVRAFDVDSNLDLVIEAKQADVNLEPYALEGIKSVTWLNG